MKLEIKPIFEWRGMVLCVGEIHFGTVYIRASYGREWVSTHKNIRGSTYSQDFFETKKEAEKFLEAKATEYLHYLLHGAQYEVSE